MQLVVSHFAQEFSPVTPLPTGPVMHLPAGNMGVLDFGRLFFYDQWVVAVGLSPHVFLVSRARDDRYVPGRLLDQLLGYLAACECEVIPVDFRFPLGWRRNSSFPAVLNLWAAQFFTESDRLLFMVQLPYSNQTMISLPLNNIAEDGAIYWGAAGFVAGAIFKDVQVQNSLRPVLARISAAWELRWNTLLNQLTVKDSISLEDREWIQWCDQAWSAVVRTHLEPFGYEMHAASLARLI
jgi:hypothetical protein